MSTVNNRIEIELDDGSKLVFHPETNTGQIYDFARGKWLNATLEEILNLLTEHSRGLVTDEERGSWNALKSGNSVLSVSNEASQHKPSYYYNLGRRTVWENWKDTTIGIPNASNISWCALITIIPYHTAEEDKLTQLAYTEYGIFTRNSVGDVTETATWGAWNKLATEATLNAHVNNSAIHITQAQKDSMTAHISNNDIHITKSEKDSMTAHIGNSGIHVTSAEKTDIANAKTHIANNNIHVTQAEKNSFTNHMNNGNLHFTVFEKEQFWNHLESESKHLTEEEKYNLINHLQNSTNHVSEAERIRWDGLKDGNSITSSVSDNSAPSVYYAMGKRTHWKNASNSSIGIVGVDGWCALQTIVPDASASSDKITQLAYTQNGIYFRVSVGSDASTATWKAWSKMTTNTDYATTSVGGVVKVDGSTININGSGVISASPSTPVYKGINVYSSTATSVPSGTATELGFNTTGVNTGHFTATSPRIYIPAGVSYVRVIAEITIADYFKSVSFYIRKNGANSVRNGGFALSYTGTAMVGSGVANAISPPISVVQGDYISIWATHYIGSASNFTLTNLSVEAL